MKNPYAAAARAISLLYSALQTSLQHDMRAQIEEDVASLQEAATEFDRITADVDRMTGSYDVGGQSHVSAFNRDGVDGPGGSLPDGWSLAEDGFTVVRESDNLIFTNAHVLRAALEADPTLADVHFQAFISQEVYDVASVGDFGPEGQSIGGLVAIYGSGRPPQTKCVRPAIAEAPEAPAPDLGSSDMVCGGRPAWDGWDEDPTKWTPEQTQTFDDWFNGLPEGAEVKIDHIGAVQAFTAAKTEWEAEKKAAAPGQEGGQDAQVEGATATGTTEGAEAAPDAAPEPEENKKKKGS